MIYELLKSEASISDLTNVLSAACQYHNYQIIEILLEELSDTVKEASVCAEAVSDTCASNNNEMFQLLLEHDIIQSPAIFYQVLEASLKNSIQMMLENGVDVNRDDNSGGHLLHTATSHIHFDIVCLLVDHGSDVQMRDPKYGSPLIAALEGYTAPALRIWAISKPAQSLAEALPLPGPPAGLYNIVGYSGLGYAKFTECEHIVQTLINQGANASMETRSNGNALHLAAFMGSEMIVQLLVDGGADLNSYGGQFETVFLAALEGNHPGIVELLLNKGINVDDPLSEYGTALQFACLNKSKSNVQLLLKHGADINASGGKCGSPLAAALSRNFPSENKENRAIVKALLQYGDSIQIRENDLVAAAADNFGYYLELLLEHDKGIGITEAVIIAAVSDNCYFRNNKVLDRLLERNGGIDITESMLKAAAKPEWMKSLLHRSQNIRISSETLEAAAKKHDTGWKLVKLLITHDPDVRTTESVIVAALKSSRFTDSGDEAMVSTLLHRSGGIEVTEAMLKAATRPDEKEVLLAHKRITTNVLEEAAGELTRAEPCESPTGTQLEC